MKKIKIKICDFDPNVEISFGRFFLKRLEQFYEVELSDDPDYVFFYERSHDHLRFPKAIRIFYTGENVHPDWNLTDYAISFDRMEFGDRHFRLPLYLAATLYDQTDIEEAGDLTFERVEPMTKEELSKKSGFCSFVYSNYLADPQRKELFGTLSTYRKVDSGGKFMNNVGGPVKHKLLFERAHKFSIAFENSSRAGYLTEKLPAALAARTIPIYYGDPTVGLEFNTKRFINAHDFPSFEAVVERVREIDQNDDLYLEIVNQPVLAPGFHYSDTLDAFDHFLRNIFDQSLPASKRRSINAVHAALLEERDRRFFAHRALIEHLRRLVAPLKRISFLKGMREKLRRRNLHF